MTFVIGSLVIVFTILFGGLFAFLFSRLDRAIVSNNAEIELEEKSYNPAMTMGFEINAQASADEQIGEARKEAAKMAAAQPRGANSRIGYREDPGNQSVMTGIKQDPWSASKIAEYHGWDGAKTGIPSGGVPLAPAAVAAPAAGGKVELVPGRDYPVIEITDSMSPDEVRRARIANSKAKSAATKAAKGAGAPVQAGAAAATAAPAQAAPVAMAVGIAAPRIIEITDAMSPDDVRKARIANSKAKSEFNKALKAAGIDPAAVEIDASGNVVMPQGLAVPAAAAPSAPIAAPAATPGARSFSDLGIAAPAFIVITDAMSPDDVRQARIANSKARSAFNKELKAKEIDPKDVEVDDSGNVTFSGTMTTAAVPVPAGTEAVTAEPGSVAPAAAAGGIDLAALGLVPPQLIEVTDAMSPDQVRQARISNSKAKSAFNKALKAAGIDPQSVDF